MAQRRAEPGVPEKQLAAGSRVGESPRAAGPLAVGLLPEGLRLAGLATGDGPQGIGLPAGRQTEPARLGGLAVRPARHAARQAPQVRLPVLADAA